MALNEFASYLFLYVTVYVYDNAKCEETFNNPQS